jgi:hypothetical protein
MHSLLITIKYSAIADLHTLVLLVSRLKRRNYNSLTKLHTPNLSAL